MAYSSFLILGLAIVTHAAPADLNTQKAIFDHRPPANTVHMGLGFRTYDYKEELDPPHKSNESGVLKHLAGELEIPTVKDPQRFFGIRASLGVGGTDYDGSLQNGQPHQTTTDNLLLDIEGIAGIKTSTSQVSHFQFFVGLARRYWRRDINGSAGYLEDYHMLLFPLGVALNQQVTEIVSIHPELTLRPLLTGYVTAHMSKLGGLNIDLPLGSRMGWRACLPVRVAHLINNAHLAVIPFIEQTNIGEGRKVPLIFDDRTQGTIHEPASTNRQYGLDIKVVMEL